MSKIKDNIKNFSANHFGNGAGKVPVVVFVMQIHEEQDKVNTKAKK